MVAATIVEIMVGGGGDDDDECGDDEMMLAIMVITKLQPGGRRWPTLRSLEADHFNRR